MPTHQLTVDAGEVTLDGRVVPVPPGANPHTVAVRAAKELADAEAAPGQSVHFEVRNAQGTFPLEITDGTVRAGTPQPARGAEQAAHTVQAATTAEPNVTQPAPASDAPGHWQPESADGTPRPVNAELDARPRGHVDDVAPGGMRMPQPGSTKRSSDADVVSSLRGAWTTNAQTRPVVPRLTGEGIRQTGASAASATNAQYGAAAATPFEHTFIETHRAEVPMQPKPVGGFAGVLAQFGIGGPSEAQRSEEADKLAVSKVWTRPKGIAVANGKGGSGKTPTSLYLAAMFARLGGGMVLVDDNNTFRGAAGWQTENAAHGATKEDLLAALPTFDGTERAADMARFTHHQTIDRYDVLQSRPQKLARDQALDDEDFDRIQAILRRFYRVVVFDSGNDESAPNWLRMIRHSDALVVPTATTPKHCESAKLLLEALTASGRHGAELARKAVIVVSHASTNDPAPEQIAPRFAGMARHVLTIPHDPAIAREWLRWDDLAPKTQRAWLAVGAAVAGELED